MTHQRASELLLDAAYGELPEGEARELAAHLAGCAACQAEAAGLEATRGLMGRLGPEPAPGGEAVLLAAARQAAQARARPPFFTRLRLGLAVSAVAVLLVGGVSLKLLSGDRVERAEAYRAPVARSMDELRGEPRGDAKGEPRPALAEAPVPAGPAEAAAASGPPPAAAPEAATAAPGRRVARKAAPADAAAPQAALPEAIPSERESLAQARPPAGGSLATPARRTAAPAAEADAGPPPEREMMTQLRDRAAAAKAAAPPPRAEAKVAARQEAVAPLPAAAAAGQARASTAGAAVPPEEAAAEEMVRGLRARREAGELNEARRRPDPCPGGDTQRLVWLDGWGKARRFARTGPAPGGGEATRDHYYDEAGRARLVVIDGSGPEGRYRRRIVLDAGGRRLIEDPAGPARWPADDLALADGAAAFWAPQRCTR